MTSLFRDQRGVAMIMVIAFMGLSIPMITGALALSGTLSKDSTVKTRILKRQYSGLAIRDYVRSGGSQTELTLNGETTTFTTNLSTNIVPDGCYPSNAGVVVGDNIIVQAGEICTLYNTTVVGNVIVEPGGALALLGSQVNGNVLAYGAAWMIIDCSGTGCTAGETTATTCSDVFFHDSAGCVVDTVYDPIDITHVIGNIQITGTTGIPPGGYSTNYICNGVDVWGNLQIFENHAPIAVGGRSICDSGITISGNLQAVDNINMINLDPALEVSDNTISGNLECTNNESPASGEPFSNTVNGDKETLSPGFDEKTDECTWLIF